MHQKGLGSILALNMPERLGQIACAMKLSSLMEKHWRVITHPQRYSPVERILAFDRFRRAHDEFVAQINEAGEDRGAALFLNELYMGLYHRDSVIPRNLDRLSTKEN